MSDPRFEFSAILIASLAGSVHCLSMCGGIALAVTERSPLSHLAYHGGRVLSYSALGALAGAFGQGLLERLPNPALRVLALGIFVLGMILMLIQTWRGEMHALPGMRQLQRLSSRLFPWGARTSPVLAGLATALLPCGWLYSFVLIAAASGSPSRGALILFAFSLGTIPVFSLAGLAIRRILSGHSIGMRRGLAIALFIVGAGSLWSRAEGWLPPHSSEARTTSGAPVTESESAHHSCH